MTTSKRPPTISPAEWARMHTPGRWPTREEIQQARNGRRVSAPTPNESDLSRDVRLLNEAEDRQAYEAAEYSRESLQ